MPRQFQISVMYAEKCFREWVVSSYVKQRIGDCKNILGIILKFLINFLLKMLYQNVSEEIGETLQTSSFRFIITYTHHFGSCTY